MIASLCNLVDDLKSKNTQMWDLGKNYPDP